MIETLNHVAIVVPDLAVAAAKYRDLLGARVSEPMTMEQDGIQIVFIELDNTKVELIQPIAADSKLHEFLKANPEGGIHHLCFGVKNITAASGVLAAAGKSTTSPQLGAHGNPIIFLDRNDFDGTLIELEAV
jgi:methylmalonyl-CoA/ethylmalonyl-CoA epimerase